MVLSNIYPIPNQKFYKNEKVIMLLAHIFDKYDPQYFSEDQHIMLDNGLYEGCQVSTNLEDIIKMAEQSPIPVKEFIVPDKFFDYDGNIKMFEENLPIIRKYNDKYQFMVSLHHSNFEEFCKAMEYMKQYKDEGLNLVMGIPKKALFDRQSDEAIEQYKNCPYPIHFLGLTDTDPLNKLNKVKDLIRSCDTSQLVTLLKNKDNSDDVMSWVRKPDSKVIDLENDFLCEKEIEEGLSKIKF